jgi:exosortase
MEAAALDAPGPRPSTFWERLLVGGILLLAVGVCIPAAQGLVYLFERVEFYAHGYLVPLVAAYLVYGERRKIAAVLRNLEPPALGAAVVLLAAVFELLMVIGDVRFASGVGIPLVLGAAAYGVGGGALVRPLGLPLAFLVLMVPPPGFLVQALLARLKLLVTQISVEILHRMGQTVYAEGNRIEVPGHQLFVADACSGLTSIITLLPVACVVAYFLSHGWWRRIVVVIGVVPLAMAANVARVVATVILVSSIGPEMAQGLLHETFGLATYALGTVLLVGVAKGLR